MSHAILGLDIGGANLKAATPDGRAWAVPFALWKQPDRLPAAVAGLIAHFPETRHLAVTMTGELCDCFQTKRDGVAAIAAAVRQAGAGRSIHVWSTAGRFLEPETATRDYMNVAAANWHALATLAGRYTSGRPAVLIDIGSTTTDVIPILGGRPVARGTTDRERLAHGELVYTGGRRTPVCAVLGNRVAAEFFATVHDAWLLLGKAAEDPADADTADGRPATRAHAHVRLSRMLGGDAETIPLAEVMALAEDVRREQVRWIGHGVRRAIARLREMQPGMAEGMSFVLSGSGEFLAREVLADEPLANGASVRSLGGLHGPAVSTCAPAFAVATLAGERDGVG
jgi:probable H4MPT-linked C1 transfer pathway protein